LVRLESKQPLRRESEPQQSLAALLSTSTVGVAILDRQLRFRTINNALASMNGVPGEAHIGKTTHHILGAAATKIETALDRVFATGDPLSNFELTARLPTRSAIGHWIENYYPIRAASGKVLEVGVIVLEVTERKNVEQSIDHVTTNLRRATKALQARRDICHRANEQAALSAAPLELLEQCMSEMRIVSELLRPKLRLGAVRHQQVLFQAGVEQGSTRENGLSPLGSDSLMNEPHARCLSHREHQVVQHLAMGKTNKEIAAILNLSVRTVETYRARVMLKLGLRSFAELVRYALRNNII